MLRTDSMPRSEDATLEQAERRFDGICMNVALHVDSKAVPNGLVFLLPAKMARRTTILVQVIGHQNVHVIGNVFPDVPFKRARFNVLGMKESQFALPLTNTNNHFFV